MLPNILRDLFMDFLQNRRFTILRPFSTKEEEFYVKFGSTREANKTPALIEEFWYHHKLHRQRALTVFTSNVQDLHCGGVPGMPVEFASHGVRLFHAHCLRRGLSAGLLFVDIKSADYRMIRQLSIGATCSRVELMKILAHLRLADHAALTMLCSTSWLLSVMVEQQQKLWA